MSASASTDSGDPSLPATPARATTGVQSLDRAVAVLDCFSEERPRLGVSEIARLTGLTTSTAHRLLDSLARHELLRRRDEGGYSLGPHLLRMARIAHAAVNLQQVALPMMRQLRDETGETVGLHVLRGTARVVVDQVESREPLRRTYTELGEPIPLHQGAPGKVLLAHLPAEVRDAVLHGTLEAATPSTITDPAALGAELERIREIGFAFSLQERVIGIRTVAVPVRDHTGAVVGSISVTGPASRVTRRRLKQMAPAAVAAGQEVSTQLGHGRPDAGSPAG